MAVRIIPARFFKGAVNQGFLLGIIRGSTRMRSIPKSKNLPQNYKLPTNSILLLNLGTKTSEAKHEIVKSNEQQNGTADGPADQLKGPAKHPTAATAAPGTPAVTPNTKRGSSGHRREKAREKHPPGDAKIPAKVTGPQPPPVTVAEVNGIVRVSASQPGPQRPVFPASTGPGPPPAAAPGAPTGPTPATANASVQGTGVKQEQGKGSATVQPTTTVAVTQGDDRSNSPPVAKKFKMEPKVGCLSPST